MHASNISRRRFLEASAPALGSARYWAAKELTRIEFDTKTRVTTLHAPFACEEFTISLPVADGRPNSLTEVDSRLKLKPGRWCREKDATLVCLKMAKGVSTLGFKS